MRLKNLTIICAVLSACATPIREVKSIPPVEVCSLRPLHAKCRDRRQSNDEYVKRWEEVIGYICLPPADIDALLNAIVD